MLIQELSEKTGLSKDTIRYYEKIGLLPKARRTSNGYRDYSFDLVKKIQLINTAKELDFSLNEIKELTNLLYGNALTKKTMATKLNFKLNEIEEKIKSLQLMKKEIKNALAGNCEFKKILE